jgi:hypothetical protein
VAVEGPGSRVVGFKADHSPAAWVQRHSILVRRLVQVKCGAVSVLVVVS